MEVLVMRTTVAAEAAEASGQPVEIEEA